jgi:cytoskeletal protein CcmA (bactofilin family)
MRFATSVNIEGTLDGDLYVTAQTIRISGVVTGDVFVAGSQWT